MTAVARAMAATARAPLSTRGRENVAGPAASSGSPPTGAPDPARAPANPPAASRTPDPASAGRDDDPVSWPTWTTLGPLVASLLPVRRGDPRSRTDGGPPERGPSQWWSGREERAGPAGQSLRARGGGGGWRAGLCPD